MVENTAAENKQADKLSGKESSAFRVNGASQDLVVTKTDRCDARSISTFCPGARFARVYIFKYIDIVCCRLLCALCRLPTRCDTSNPPRSLCVTRPPLSSHTPKRARRDVASPASAREAACPGKCLPPPTCHHTSQPTPAQINCAWSTRTMLVSPIHTVPVCLLPTGAYTRLVSLLSRVLFVYHSCAQFVCI
ncbi:hypothetical protein FRC12_009996 [Ceratobasidium sp. 428]|nr:hypothetical protein FRC12_009996 [Ceratobasidium sp. 428]